MKNYSIKHIPLFIIVVLLLPSCEEFIEIDPPRTDLVSENVFTTDAKATAVMMEIYYQWHVNGFASGDLNSVSFYGALLADEALNRVDFDLGYTQMNENALDANTQLITLMWSEFYSTIYKCNAIIEGLRTSTGVSEELQTQLDGEAKFIRAFCLFYLTNLFGDVPIVLTTDYEVNQSIAKSPQSEVYDQILADLEHAQTVLPENFEFMQGQRIRPTKGTAQALLARTYLFLRDWQKAEQYATMLIDDSALFSLVPIQQSFLKDNKESIFQLLPQYGNAHDREVARVWSFVRTELLDAFEANDARKTEWVSGFFGNLANKYKALNNRSDNSVIMRLSEQYLIRAEARAELDDVEGAQEDVNIIRQRGNLSPTLANDKASLLSAILQERRIELFNEWGHRWFDLRRHNRSAEFLSPVKADWQETDLLLPIPEVQIINNPSMRDAQNPGY